MLRMAAAPFSETPAPAIRSGAVECWQPARLPQDPWLVLRLAGYRRGDTVAAPIQAAASRMTARAAELVEPRARCRATVVVASGPDGAGLADGIRFSGRAVGGLLTGCPLAVVFALTLGGRLEAEVAALGDAREALDAFLLDTAGWAAIETAVRGLRLDLAARARAAGWRITHRLAPGYADWPLEEQPALLRALGDVGGLVRLSEHGVLTPFKSVTGLFGLAPPRAAGS
jgi:hypothetical protein